jgi:hypothetical protein
MNFFSLVQCLCCQVEVSATSRSLIQRSPTECGVCLSVIKWKPQHLLWGGTRGEDYEMKRSDRTVEETDKMYDMIINSSRTSVLRCPLRCSRNTLIRHGQAARDWRDGEFVVNVRLLLFVCAISRGLLCPRFFVAVRGIRWHIVSLSQKADFIDIWGTDWSLNDFTEWSRILTF